MTSSPDMLWPLMGREIRHGRLDGLQAWRFVVQNDQGPSAAIETNFLFDDTEKFSTVAPEVLKALGHTGDLAPGTPVVLRLQGIRTACRVGRPGEASRLHDYHNMDVWWNEELDQPMMTGSKDLFHLIRPSTYVYPPPIRFVLRDHTILNMAETDAPCSHHYLRTILNAAAHRSMQRHYILHQSAEIDLARRCHTCKRDLPTLPAFFHFTTLYLGFLLHNISIPSLAGKGGAGLVR
jgi:hypothetical protein